MNAVIFKVIALNESNSNVFELRISGEQFSRVEDIAESRAGERLSFKAEGNISKNRIIVKGVKIRFNSFKSEIVF